MNERIYGGAAWLLFSVALAVESFRLGVGDLGRPGPGFLAFCAAVLMGWQATVMLVSGAWQGGDPEQPAAIDWRPLLPVLLVLLLYVGLLPSLGFVVASFLLVLALMLLTDRAAWRQALLVAFVAVGLSHLVFVVLLGVRLPLGLLALGMR